MQPRQGLDGRHLRRAEKNLRSKELLKGVRQLKRCKAFAGIIAAWPALGHLLEAAEATLGRSTTDVFPFHLREVERYHQCADIHTAAQGLLKELTTSCVAGRGVPQGPLLRKVLTRLEGIVAPLVLDPTLAAIVATVERTNKVFCEVRAILGKEGPSGEEVQARMQEFLATLADDPAIQPTFGELAWRLDYYGRELYVAYDNSHVPRTNNALEDFNKAVKRPIRKCRGQKDSWFYLEHDAEGVATYHNLLHGPHVVGGTDIASQEDVTPLERAGVLPSITVSAIMKLVNYEKFVVALDKHDARHAIHRWTRRINKQGLPACLQAISKEFHTKFDEVASNEVGIKTGEN